MNQTEAYYHKMTTTPVARLIIALGIPTTVSMLITSVYNMADTYFVGALGESQQAATGILFTLQAIIQAIAFMLGQGSGTLVSKSLADKDTKGASAYVSSSFFLGGAMGVLLAIVGLCTLNPFLRLLGSTDTILPYARQYGFWVLVAAPFVIGSFVLNNNLRYEGKSFYAMIGIGSGGIINIFGDYLFIRVCSLGVFGAGMATAISQLISFGLLLYFHEKKAQASIRLFCISRRARLYGEVCRQGFPALIRQGLSSIGNGLLNNLTKPHGDAAIAAMSVVQRFANFIMCVGLGIGQGFQPVASYNHQAKKYRRVKQGLVVTMVIGAMLISCIALPAFIMAEDIVRLFQKSPEVIEIGAYALRWSSIGVMFLSLSVPVNMLYQSIRRPELSSFLSMLRSGLAFIPVLLLTTSLWQLRGVQISQPIADILTGLISVPFIVHYLVKTPGEDVPDQVKEAKP
jgi:putative MATE family efflux protein